MSRRHQPQPRKVDAPMLSYLPDDSARAHVRDLILTAQSRDRQQAWIIKKHYELESAQPKYELWDRKTPRKSMA